MQPYCPALQIISHPGRAGCGDPRGHSSVSLMWTRRQHTLCDPRLAARRALPEAVALCLWGSLTFVTLHVLFSQRMVSPHSSTRHSFVFSFLLYCLSCPCSHTFPASAFRVLRLQVWGHQSALSCLSVHLNAFVALALLCLFGY